MSLRFFGFPIPNLSFQCWGNFGKSGSDDLDGEEKTESWGLKTLDFRAQKHF